MNNRMRPVVDRSVVLLLLLVSTAIPVSTNRASGQAGSDQIRLEKVAEAPMGFTKVGGVRELSDGRLLVVDQLEIEGYLLDRSLNSRSTIARKGSGPKEYRTPYWIIPLAGDSSAIVDIGLLRLLLLDAEGQPYDVVSRERAGGGRILRLSHTYRYASDGGQYLYSEGANMEGSPGEYDRVDSISIERWRLGDAQRDTVAMIPYNWIGPHPFRPQPGWAVCSSGRVGIAYPDPYHVEIVTPGGDHRQSGLILHDPVPVTEEIKEAWLDLGDVLVHSALRGGGDGAWEVRSGGRRREPEAWPRALPPFLDDAVHCAPNEDIWIQRATPPDEPVLVDVLDGDGNSKGQVQLPANGRVVGFGQGVVYVVVKDPFDLEHLFKLRVPREM